MISLIKKWIRKQEKRRLIAHHKKMIDSYERKLFQFARYGILEEDVRNNYLSIIVYRKKRIKELED